MALRITGRGPAVAGNFEVADFRNFTRGRDRLLLRGFGIRFTWRDGEAVILLTPNNDFSILLAYVLISFSIKTAATNSPR